eukprot:GFUD01017262.1.p1 GENE.GFUD01017262.1~~GFUD01017262.1.p1  ORF type:complete len:283 (-),score=83.31 GFUD01017262.1:74-922(-)
MEENNNNNMMSYRQKCIDFGVHTNKFLLAKMDTREIEKMMAEQIREVGGSQWLYKDINKNMKNGIFDPFFLREHCNLYSWRETFFDAHFAGNSWFTVESDQYGEEEEDYFSWDDPFTRFITIPVQLTQHFDSVLALATAKIEPELQWLKAKVYFTNDEILGNEAESKYNLETMISDLNEPELVIPEGFLMGHSLRDHYDQVDLSFSDVAHIVVEVYQKGPKKLEELSIKAILKNRISIKQLPPSIQKKVVHGMYAIKDSTPKNITDEGKLIYEKIKRVFSKK